jgi:predicted acyl esterase
VPRRVAAAVLLLVPAILTLAAVGAGTARAAAAFVARGSAEQVYATGLKPGGAVTLIDRRGKVVARKRPDSRGGVVFRLVTPGHGYRMRQGSLSSADLTVFSDRPAPPSTKSYAQKIPARGYGYLATRDGTKLAIDVRTPNGGPGPFPTLVEYSGYGYANPAGAQSGISQIANLLGFAVVDVNMRGTGCSGGSFDYFEQLQNLDGYDVVETVARQPWVLHHRVGMMGISYGGISQLFVAATDPPHLAAIAPLSVLDNSATTLYPGGILNTGFALTWSEQRAADAQPAGPHTGQAWAWKQIQSGDQICAQNQVLHGEAADLVARVRAGMHYVPSVWDPVAPITFVKRIKVPTYLACQWTDEQTGGHCADLASHFTGTRRKWFTFDNGAHVDSLDPATFNRWYDFLELYVARRPPDLSPAVRALAPLVYQVAMGINGVTLPPDPLQGLGSYSAALAAFERLQPIRVMFDNGAGSSVAGAPYAAFEHSFASFPVPGTRARSWYLRSGGTLGASAPRAGAADRFTWSKRARSATSFTGDTSAGPGGLWTAIPTYHWNQDPPGTAAVYASAPLKASTVVIGAGAVHLWVKASVPSVDLQVTVSEVRPDGNETFVQDGWLRADERKLDPAKSTLLEPVPSFRAADVAALPTGKFTEITVPLYYEGHAYRRGSRIRIAVSAPGGDQPVWSFAETQPAGKARVQIAHSRAFPSRVILPVVPGVGVPKPLAPCPSLRNEPCRSYRAYANRTRSLTVG